MVGKPPVSKTTPKKPGLPVGNHVRNESTKPASVVSHAAHKLTSTSNSSLSAHSSGGQENARPVIKSAHGTVASAQHAPSAMSGIPPRFKVPSIPERPAAAVAPSASSRWILF
jgi:hypothetical protein